METPETLVSTLIEVHFWHVPVSLPGQESGMLEKPHTILSRGTVTYHTKVLRVFYTRSCPEVDAHRVNGPRMRLAHKTFHIPIWNRVADIRLSSEVIDDPALRYRGEALYRLSTWLKLSGKATYNYIHIADIFQFDLVVTFMLFRPRLSDKYCYCTIWANFVSFHLSQDSK